MLKTGLESLPALYAFVGDTVNSAVFNKAGTGFNKTKSSVKGDTFVIKIFDPGKIQRTRTVIILTTGNHLLYLSGREIIPNADRADKRRRHNALMFERQFQQQGNTLIGTPLIFTSDIEKNVIPPFSPISGQIGGYTLRSLGQQKKTTSGRCLMIFQASTRQASASSRKKSDVIHTRSCSPLLTL